MLLLFAALAGYQLRVALLQAQLRAGTVVWMGVGQAVFSIVLPLVLVRVGSGGAVAVISAVALSYGLSLVLAPPAAARHAVAANTTEGSPEPRHVLKSLFGFGWGLSLWFATMSAMPLTDRFLIERMHSVAATGQYAALYDLVTRSFSLLAFPVTLAAHPRIMRHWTAGRQAHARTTWKWAMAAQVGVFVAVLVVAVIVGGPLVRIVLPKSRDVSSALIPLLFAGFAWQFALLAHKPLEVASRTPWMVVAAAAALAVSVGGNIWLLPRYGPVAAAYTYGAAAVAYLLVVFSVALAFRAHLMVRPPSGDGEAA